MSTTPPAPSASNPPSSKDERTVTDNGLPAGNNGDTGVESDSDLWEAAQQLVKHVVYPGFAVAFNIFLERVNTLDRKYQHTPDTLSQVEEVERDIHDLMSVVDQTESLGRKLLTSLKQEIEDVSSGKLVIYQRRRRRRPAKQTEAAEDGDDERDEGDEAEEGEEEEDEDGEANDGREAQTMDMDAGRGDRSDPNATASSSTEDNTRTTRKQRRPTRSTRSHAVGTEKQESTRQTASDNANSMRGSSRRKRGRGGDDGAQEASAPARGSTRAGARGSADNTGSDNGSRKKGRTSGGGTELRRSGRRR